MSQTTYSNLPDYILDTTTPAPAAFNVLALTDDEALRHYLSVDTYRATSHEQPRCGFCWASYPVEVYAKHVQMCNQHRDKLLHSLYGCTTSPKTAKSNPPDTQSHLGIVITQCFMIFSYC